MGRLREKTKTMETKLARYPEGKAPPLISPFRNDILNGKVALITGGGSGIGFGIATELGKHGASVVIMGRRETVLAESVAKLEAMGIKAKGVQGDVRDYEKCTGVIDAAVAAFGHLNILVNCAAGNFMSP